MASALSAGVTHNGGVRKRKATAVAAAGSRKRTGSVQSLAAAAEDTLSLPFTLPNAELKRLAQVAADLAQLGPLQLPPAVPDPKKSNLPVKHRPTCVLMGMFISDHVRAAVLQHLAGKKLEGSMLLATKMAVWRELKRMAGSGPYDDLGQRDKARYQAEREAHDAPGLFAVGSLLPVEPA
jgi:hypothetical protein